MYDDDFELTFDRTEEDDAQEPVKLPAEQPQPAAEAKPEPAPEEPTRVIPAVSTPEEATRILPELPHREAPKPAEPAPQPTPAAPSNGYTVLISGGDRGIGAAAARAFYAAGYRVAVRPFCDTGTLPHVQRSHPQQPDPAGGLRCGRRQGGVLRFGDGSVCNALQSPSGDRARAAGRGSAGTSAGVFSPPAGAACRKTPLETASEALNPPKEPKKSGNCVKNRSFPLYFFVKLCYII